MKKAKRNYLLLFRLFFVPFSRHLRRPFLRRRRWGLLPRITRSHDSIETNGVCFHLDICHELQSHDGTLPILTCLRHCLPQKTNATHSGKTAKRWTGEINQVALMAELKVIELSCTEFLWASSRRHTARCHSAALLHAPIAAP